MDAGVGADANYGVRGGSFARRYGTKGRERTVEAVGALARRYSLDGHLSGLAYGLEGCDKNDCVDGVGLCILREDL